MELGAFSVSLAVDDLEVSRAFYEKLGFEKTGGDGEPYYMLRNAEADRDIRGRLLEAGLEMARDLEHDGTGPDSIVLEDPDGNPVLIDQHVPKPSDG